MKFFEKKQSDYEQFIVKILDEPKLLKSRKEWALNHLDKKFKEYRHISDFVFEELNFLVNENPQFIIDIISESFTSEIFTTFLANLRKKYDTPLEKMSKISLVWEIASFFKFGAYLISRRQVPLDSLSEKNSILKYFRPFGLTNDMIEKTRKIRNTKNHRFTIKKGILIDKSNGQSLEITFNEINELESKLESIASWWFTFLSAQFLCIPKFGILFLYTILSKIKKNQEFIKEYFDGLIEFIPESNYNSKQIPFKKRIKKNIKRFKKRIKYKIRKIFKYDPAEIFIYENFEYFWQKISYHTKDIAEELKNISEMLTNNDDKSKFEKFSIWFEKSVPEYDQSDIIKFKSKILKKSK